MKLRIHYFQHESFEGPGCIREWCLHRGHSLTATFFFENVSVPSVDEYDWLVVMGGHMGVHDEDQYPWLVEEKKAIREAIDHGKTVLGICLGAQLVASVLGAAVGPASRKEIGWFNINLTREGQKHPLLEGFPGSFDVFQWHGDAFDIPEGAVRLASSEACSNPAFRWGRRVLGLQFHFEVTHEDLDKMLEDVNGELNQPDLEADGSPPSPGGVQSKARILAASGLVDETNTKMFQLLDRLESVTKT
ncbi:MAG: type 1 glutamine amidotransferase [Marinilabilia sp.]